MVKVITYQTSSSKDYSWRMERNGRVVATSADTYTRRDSALKAAQHLVKALKGKVEFVCE